MTNDDSKKSEKDKPSADGFSFADLLSSGNDSRESDDGPERVDHRDDERDSGIVNIADMVADGSADSDRPSKFETPVAPSSSVQAQPSELAARPDLTFSTPPAPLVSAGRNKKILAIAGGALGLVALVVILVFALGSGDEEEIDKIAELEAKLKQVENEKKLARLAAEMKKKDESEAAAETEQEEPGEEAEASETEEPRAENSKPNPKPAKATVNKPATSEPEPAEEPKEQPRGDGSELDKLLGGGVAKPTSGGGGGNKPRTPSREDVMAVMGPITRQAASCSSHATGTVQMKIVVASTGRIKMATATGAFANTSAGRCVEKKVRKAKFPAFTKPTFSFTYPIRLK